MERSLRLLRIKSKTIRRYYFTSTTKMHTIKTTGVCQDLEKQAFIIYTIQYAVATLEGMLSSQNT